LAIVVRSLAPETDYLAKRNMTPDLSETGRLRALSGETTASQVTVDERVSDSVESQLADHDGQDYLLIVESGTRLKIYAIRE
jgi:hypothetical protein